MDGIPLGRSYTWAGARAAGVTRRQIERDGVRLGKGLYLSQAAEPTLFELCRAWARVLPACAAFGEVTAAAFLGAPVAAQPRPTVVLPPDVVVPARRELIRRIRTMADEDVVRSSGPAVTSGPQTLLDWPPSCHRPSWSPSATPCTAQATWTPPGWANGWPAPTGSAGCGRPAGARPC